MRAIRAKLSQLHHGRSLFHVNVDVSRGCLNATMRKSTCMGRPWDAKIHRNKVSLFINTEQSSRLISPGETYTAERSLIDCAVVWHGGRNLHRLFTKEKQARKYMDRINAGCLSAAEREHLADSLRWGRFY